MTGRRRSIVIDGFDHGDNPIPVACRVDNIVQTGAVMGYDAQAKRFANGLEAQCAQMFAHLAAILQSAGATFEDVVKMSFYVRARDSKAAINREWVRAFPDPASRPARHTLVSDTPGDCLVQCDAVAVIRAS